MYEYLFVCSLELCSSSSLRDVLVGVCVRVLSESVSEFVYWF